MQYPGEAVAPRRTRDITSCPELVNRHHIPQSRIFLYRQSSRFWRLPWIILIILTRIIILIRIIGLFHSEDWFWILKTTGILPYDHDLPSSPKSRRSRAGGLSVQHSSNASKSPHFAKSIKLGEISIGPRSIPGPPDYQKLICSDQ